MADESVVNGADVEIATNEHDSDTTSNQTVQKLMQKLEILEQEKQQLVNDNDSAAAKIKELEDEIKTSESDKRALSSIAARAAELETEVSRLQHDLISSMSEGAESNAELSELKRVVEELKKSELEKSEKVDVIEKERNLLLEKLKESENQIREFEKKIEGFESDMRIEKMKVEEYRSMIAKNEDDIEKWKKEKDDVDIVKNNLEVLLKKSEKEWEAKFVELRRQLESFEKGNCDEKNINGIAGNGDDKVLNSNKVDWPVIAVTAGAVATVAVVYFRHAKF